MPNRLSNIMIPGSGPVADRTCFSVSYDPQATSTFGYTDTVSVYCLVVYPPWPWFNVHEVV